MSYGSIGKPLPAARVSQRLAVTIVVFTAALAITCAFFYTTSLDIGAVDKSAFSKEVAVGHSIPGSLDEQEVAVETEKETKKKHASSHNVTVGPPVEISAEDLQKLEQDYQVGTKAYYHAKYRLEHPHSQYKAAWRAAHHEEVHAAAKAKYQAEHPADVEHAAFKSKYQQEHIDEHTTFKAQYHQDHPKEMEHAKFKAQFQQEHPKEVEHAKFKAKFQQEHPKVSTEATAEVAALPSSEKTVFKAKAPPGLIYSQAWGPTGEEDKQAVWEPTKLPNSLQVAAAEKEQRQTGSDQIADTQMLVEQEKPSTAPAVVAPVPPATGSL